jgi:hypothetical protein
MPQLKIKAASVLLSGFCFVLLAPLGFGAPNDAPSLKSLYDAHRWFELRDATAKGGVPVFYQGAVACAFNDLHQCEKKLGAVVKSHPRSDEAIQAHGILVSVYLRQGKYREALTQIDAVLAVKPEDAEPAARR